MSSAAIRDIHETINTITAFSTDVKSFFANLLMAASVSDDQLIDTVCEHVDTLADKLEPELSGLTAGLIELKHFLNDLGIAGCRLDVPATQMAQMQRTFRICLLLKSRDTVTPVLTAEEIATLVKSVVEAASEVPNIMSAVIGAVRIAVHNLPSLDDGDGDDGDDGDDESSELHIQSDAEADEMAGFIVPDDVEISEGEGEDEEVASGGDKRVQE